MTMALLKAHLLMLLGAASMAAACSGNSTTTTTTAPSTIASTSARVFVATLAIHGASFYSVSLTRPGTVELTLVSVTLVDGGATETTTMGMGIGTPNGSGCDLTDEINTAPGLTAQLKRALAVGTYCAKVFDIGTLKTPVNVGVRIVIP